MDVHNQPQQISLTLYRDPSEGTLEQGSCSLDGDVETASISIEEVGKVLMRLFDFRIKTCQVSKI